MVKVKLNGKIYKCEVADDEESREVGLQEVAELPENEGLLFVFDEEDEVSFWMKDTLINLDIIFLNEDNEVIKVATGYAGTEIPHTAENCMYVLEVNQGSGAQIGDEVEIQGLYEEEEKEDPTAIMMVLDEDGESQMDLKGGERIFSRKNTKVLVTFAKRAWKSKQDKDYKALGRKAFKFLRTQNEREEEYVKLPETKKD